MALTAVAGLRVGHFTDPRRPTGCTVVLLPEGTARRAARTMAIEVLPLSDDYLNRRLLTCVQRLSALPAPAQRLVEQLRGASGGVCTA